MVSFRKKVKILPGLSLNFSKSGISTTIGTRGASVTIGKKGTYVNAGIPGTGIYTRKKVSGTKAMTGSRRRSSTYAASPTYSTPENLTYRRYAQMSVPVDSSVQIPLRSKAANMAWGTVFAIMGLVCLILAFVSPLVMFGRFVVGGIGIFCFIASVSYFTSKSIDDDINEEKVREEKRKETKVIDSKAKVVAPAMKEIPEYNDQSTAAAAFDVACLNFGLANTVDEILDTAEKATACLSYAKIPMDASWGTDSVLPLYKKMRVRQDDALIRVAMNIRYVGSDFSDLENFLCSDDGKSKWSATFA